jgi:hypothetical protein
MKEVKERALSRTPLTIAIPDSIAKVHNVDIGRFLNGFRSDGRTLVANENVEIK